MSHYFAGVIVKEGTLEEVNALMDPYDENLPENREPEDEEEGKETENATQEEKEIGESYWDWWVVGGRWDGVIKGKPTRDGDGFNFGNEHHQLEHNTIEVDQLLKALGKLSVLDEVITRLKGEEIPTLPCSIVTPDGFEGDINDERVIEILKQYAGQGYKIVGVDYHN